MDTERQSSPRRTVAILSRGDAAARRDATSKSGRFVDVFEALAEVGIEGYPVIYDESFAVAVREQLLAADGVLVWVNPIQDGRNRAHLDALLRDVAAQGVWVSAHPDVILKMGTKEVLYRTRSMGWGSDTALYETAEAMRAELPRRLIEQAGDGTLMLGQEGEKVGQSRSFFAVFESNEEWRLTTGGRTLGTLPIMHPIHKEGLVVFAGQRWIVQDLDEQTMTLVVAPHPGGVVPRFEPAAGEPAHDRLIAEMRKVYLADDVPPYLDARAQDLLAEGRDMFRELDLESRSLVEEERDTHIFLWRGSQTTAVFSAALAMAGLQSGVHELGVTVSKIKESELRPIISKLAEMRNIDPHDVSEFVANIKVGKFREQIPESLARSLWATQNGDKVIGIAVMAESL